MDGQIGTWKRHAERLFAAEAFDYRAAAQLAADIAHAAQEPTLRQKAAQALTSLRSATAKSDDRWGQDVARRRFAVLRDCLHTLSAPRFGKRGRPQASMISGSIGAGEHNRRMLGLPLDRRLFGPEIREAYKRAAKSVHPDAGGTEQAFRELCDARDALLKEI